MRSAPRVPYVGDATGHHQHQERPDMYPMTPDFLKARVEGLRHEANPHRRNVMAQGGVSRRSRHGSRRAGFSGKTAPSES
jgi:hypothetical protein